MASLQQIGDVILMRKKDGTVSVLRLLPGDRYGTKYRTVCYGFWPIEDLAIAEKEFYDQSEKIDF